MANKLAQQRVIGIRHSLRAFKDAGLVEEKSLFPKEGVGDVRKRLVRTAAEWYQIGARRGVREALELILDGKIVIEKRGRIRELITYIDHVEWETRLRINVGITQHVRPSRKYKVRVSAVGFKPVEND